MPDEKQQEALDFALFLHERTPQKTKPLQSTPGVDNNFETPLPEAEEKEYVEPYLTNENGFWVIAGGRKMSREDVQRDFVAEMREERIRSFFPNTVESNRE